MSENQENIEIKLKKSGNDNISDSLTTYSLMAVLAGTIFITILQANLDTIFLSKYDKLFVLFTSLVSLCIIFLAIETAIDIFHFGVQIDSVKDLQRKYNKQLICYNLGVIFLILTFIYSFFSYLFYLITSNEGCFLKPDCICIYFFPLLFTILVFSWVSKKWIKDINFVCKGLIKVIVVPENND